MVVVVAGTVEVMGPGEVEVVAPGVVVVVDVVGGGVVVVTLRLAP